MGGVGSAGGVSVAWATASDVGLHRAANEDAVLAAAPVFVVADGMGGHQSGDVAAALVIEQFSTFAGSEPGDPDLVTHAIQTVNTEIFEVGEAATTARSMGTTAVGLVLVHSEDSTSWLVFNIGDSRAYRLAGGEFELLSVDHSYVQELVDAGKLTEDEARLHPRRNVVTRALGVDEIARPDVWMRAPVLGERFLLCSDGLSSEVSDEMIRQHLVDGDDVSSIADALVAQAIAEGGHDNVTVLVLDVVGCGVPDPGVAANGATTDDVAADETLDGPGGSSGREGGTT